MKKVTELPDGKIDKRYVYPIDQLRAKYWLSQLISQGYNSEYHLAQIYGGTQHKWKNYAKGGQPNDDVLDQIDRRYEGSRSWYTSGPQGLKLWPALAPEISEEVLSIIAQASSNVDGKIAEFRLDAINDKISEEIYDPADVFREFESRQNLIINSLHDVLSGQNLEDAISIFKEIVQTYINSYLRPFYEEAMSASESKYTPDDYIKMKYEELELHTVKQKGNHISKEELEDRIRIEELENKYSTSKSK